MPSRSEKYLALLIVASLLSGCGYTSRSLLEQNVRSIYIKIFDNETFRRDLEFDLTKAIKEEILLRTRLKVVDKKHADSILFGSIETVTERVLIESPDAEVIESSVSTTVRFSWTDQRTGRAIIDKHKVAASAEFIVTKNEDVGIGEQKAFVNVARKIVNLMERDW
ncbi:MAG: LptE family protein [Planctomycetes bacterium]|nr:LptE family protein [Planctomycetota bacterium]